MTDRLAIVTTHPIQYYAPWFRHLSAVPGLELRVFYLWDFGVVPRRDPRFGHAVQWDVPLLDGYEHEFVPNASPRPGTDRVWGIWNPDLPRRVRRFDPTAVLFLTYNHASAYQFLAGWQRGGAALLFRGDSHRLVPRPGRMAAARRRFIATVFARFDAFLHVGAANRRYFEEHGVPQSRLFFAPHAVDNARFTESAEAAERQSAAWRAELGIPPDHQVVLFAGKFEPKKRPLDLLRAFRDADVPGTSLLFVGAGELEPALRDAALGDPRIFFAPFQNQTLMPRTYAAADLFVLPSFGPDETWGLAVNEAMCLARPVIVSTHVGCAEDLVKPRRTGLVFPAGDVGALTGALREALSNDARLRDWGRHARDAVSAYSYEAATAGLLRALEATRRRQRGALRATG